MLVATVVVITLIFVGSAVAQNSSFLSVCSPDQYGQQRCDSSTDPNACIVDGSIVHDQYTCDQIAQRALEEANRRAQEAATRNIATPATTPTTPATSTTPTTPTPPTTPATATTPENTVTS